MQHPYTIPWHLRFAHATQLSEQHRAARACDSNSGTETTWFKETSLKYKLKQYRLKNNAVISLFGLI